MHNTYLALLNSKGNENLRDIILNKDFEEYRKNLKKLTTLQKRLQNIENTIFGPIDKIDAFHHLDIGTYVRKQPIMSFDFISNQVIFYKKDSGFSRFEDKKVEVCKFSLDKLNLFNEAALSTIRNLALEKLRNFEQTKNKLQKKKNYTINIEFEDDLLERFIILLVSNYQYISYANGDFEKALSNYELIKNFIDFSKDNDSIKNKTLEEFIKIFSEHIISNDDISSKLSLELPSLEGLNELFDIYHSCLNTSFDNLEKVPNYEFLINEFLYLSHSVLEYEEKLPK